MKAHRGGKSRPPTGMEFALPPCAVGRWGSGIMTEERLYWNNATYMKRIGLVKQPPLSGQAGQDPRHG